MDWAQIGTQVILYIVGAVITVLGSLASYFISKKIKDEKLKSALSNALQVVTDGVDYVYQTYVQGLKGTSLWDEEAMKTANKAAIDYIMNKLPQECIDYIQKNGEDLEEWVKEQIEIAIKKSKDNSCKSSSNAACK